MLQQAEKDERLGGAHGKGDEGSKSGKGEVTEAGEGQEVLPGQEVSPRFEDHRHNLTLWARPPQRLRDVIGECQRRLREIVPGEYM